VSFVHLHVHSQYSLLRAASKIEDLVKKCVEYNMPALALTDYGNLFGALELYFTCKENGIKPIIGSEVYLTENRLEKKRKIDYEQSLVLLAQNEEGYRNLCHISTVGYQEGFYYIPRVDDFVLKKYSQNIIALTGGETGQVFKTYRDYGSEKALNRIKELKSVFKDRLYLEYGKTSPQDYNQFLKEVSTVLSLPLVATNNVHYTERKDYIIQDVLRCIGENNTLENKKREDKEQEFKSVEQMRTLFKDEDISLIQNTLAVADRCQLEFQLKDEKNRPVYHLPTPVLEKKKNLKLELKYLAEGGLKRKFKGISHLEKYQKRLKEELDIIDSMGFTGYFLIVHEFVHWAKQQEIPVGPGRGSGASSLVAYTLGITDLDPMPQNLLFERFLNPERISMPDFDVDFCQEQRNRVIQHVQETYGKDYVAQVITFGRLQARAAIRDVGRVLSMSYSDVDAIVKLIPERLGITLQDALNQNPALKELTETDSQIFTLMDLAQRIEGLVRHVSIHAAGVIIADKPILHYGPLYRGAEDENVIQFDLKYAKKIGLVKFDFLGLKTLTHIQRAFELIKKNRNKKIHTEDISLSDEGIYQIMSQGDTLGIFQFEGKGITDLIRKAKPTCFEDIIAINALFRPGPMDMIPTYLERRKSKTAKYIFQELEPILRETHGIVVYQEQVLLISAMIAGYSYAEADVLRRAMGEKIPSEMKKQKTRFLSGAKKKNHDLKKAEKLFDTVAEFAKYGFNKAHAAAYCVLAAQTAWLKHYYPVEFFAALLTTEMGDTVKVTKYIQNARGRGIKLKSPHVNYSEYEFSVHDEEIYFALGAVKGVGGVAVRHIVSVREKTGPFKSFDHFLESVDFKRVNKKTIDSLVKAGAFDGLGYERFEIASNFDLLIEKAEKKKQDILTGQSDLFSLLDEGEAVCLAHSKKWSNLEKLNYEKQVIGFYLSEHPLDYFKPYLRSYPSETIQEITEKPKDQIKVWGIIENLREVKTRKGATMGFAQLGDRTGQLDLVFFSSVYLDNEKLLQSDEPVYIEGRFQPADNKCIVEKVIPLSLLLLRVNKVEISISDQIKDRQMEGLKQIIESNEGSSMVVFNINIGASSLRMKSQTPLSVNFSVLEEMREFIPPENIKFS